MSSNKPKIPLSHAHRDELITYIDDFESMNLTDNKIASLKEYAKTKSKSTQEDITLVLDNVKKYYPIYKKRVNEPPVIYQKGKEPKDPKGYSEFICGVQFLKNYLKAAKLDTDVAQKKGAEPIKQAPKVTDKTAHDSIFVSNKYLKAKAEFASSSLKYFKRGTPFAQLVEYINSRDKHNLNIPEKNKLPDVFSKKYLGDQTIMGNDLTLRDTLVKVISNKGDNKDIEAIKTQVAVIDNIPGNAPVKEVDKKPGSSPARQ